MPWPLQRSSIVIAALAAVFYAAFMFAKHDPALRPLIPFGVDPYDAVGSFGVIIAVVAALIALVRAFRPYRQPPDAARRMYLVRTHAIVVFAVFITLGADAVAMGRHLDSWMRAPARNTLIALLAALAIAASAALQLIRVSRENGSGSWNPALLVAIVCVAVLALYPEPWIESFSTHMLTVVIGAIVLFAPMRLMVTALVAAPTGADGGSPPRTAQARGRWIAAALIGIVIGLFAFLGEVSEGTGSMPFVRIAFVAAVFIGLALAGLLIAYGFLGKPLGFGR